MMYNISCYVMIFSMDLHPSQKQAERPLKQGEFPEKRRNSPAC